jgi:hypothetical protein
MKCPNRPHASMGISAQGAEHLSMKIGRANKHVREFDSLVVAHCTRPDLFTTTGRDDIKNGRYIVRVEYTPFAGDILLSLGDFACNLRSGLDQLAWQLCLVGEKFGQLSVATLARQINVLMLWFLRR